MAMTERQGIVYRFLKYKNSWTVGQPAPLQESIVLLVLDQLIRRGLAISDQGVYKPVQSNAGINKYKYPRRM